MSKEIAQGVRIIRPYKRQPSSMRTLEGSLYQNGYNFIPGTVRKFFPRVDSRGVIRTGLDENSPKIRAICKKHGVPYVQNPFWVRVVKLAKIMGGDADMLHWESGE